MGFLAAVPALLAGSATAATAAGAATGMTMLGTGLAAGGSILSGIGSMKAANYQAAVANNNAKILEQQADQSRQAGQREESMQRLRVGQLVGEQMAAQAANGVDVGIGSPAMVRDSTKALGDFDALTIRYNAAKQAWGQEVEAVNQRAQAAQAKSAGKMALLSSFIGAAASITGGLGKIAGMQAASKLYGLGGNGYNIAASGFGNLPSYSFGAP